MTGVGWLTRYEAGHRREVWHELRRLGDRVREPRHLPEARAVCDAMALRARANVDLLVEGLGSQGFVFTTNDGRRSPVPAHVPPTPQAPALATWLEETFEVPLALTSWVRHVGDVWLVGHHPDWPDADAGDPLVVELEGSRHPGIGLAETRAYLLDEREQWQESWEEDPAAAGPLVLPIAPDRLHKANVSGGPPSGILVPDRTAEGTLRSEVERPFVAHLDRAFARGGFPHPTAHPRVHAALTRTLAPMMLRL